MSNAFSLRIVVPFVCVVAALSVVFVYGAVAAQADPAMPSPVTMKGDALLPPIFQPNKMVKSLNLEDRCYKILEVHGNWIKADCYEIDSGTQRIVKRMDWPTYWVCVPNIAHSWVAYEEPKR